VGRGGEGVGKEMGMEEGRIVGWDGGKMLFDKGVGGMGWDLKGDGEGMGWSGVVSALANWDEIWAF
tara:strand:- start:5763 stop:5960 length:198 start_codon:yes stop_codon:yes gene_type:complete